MREVMLIIHFIGLAMALGAGFANLFLNAVASKLEPAERGGFMSKIVILGRMGQIGLGLLILSGLSLTTPYWKVLNEMPLFIAKLSLVSLLLISVIMILFILRKAKKQGKPALLKNVKPLGMINFVIGITIVVLAVLIFR
jgi:hypothetical protein